MMKILSIILLLSTFSIIACITCRESPGESDQGIVTISTEEAEQLIADNQDNPDFSILDIRTPAEYNDVRLEDAINIDFYSSTFSQDLDVLDKNGIYLVYCSSGNRSGQSLSTFKELGFKKVYNMDGGITRWISEGRPVVE